MRARVLAAGVAAAGVVLTAAGCAREQENYSEAFRQVEVREVLGQQVEAPVWTPANTPQDAVSQWLEQIQQWDGSPQDWPDFPLAPEAAQAAQSVISAVTRQIDYELGNAKVNGNRAEVDLSISAPDLTRSFRSILEQALGRAALERAVGLPLQWETQLLDQLDDALSQENNLKITRRTTAHVVMGGDGQWKLDLNSTGNLDFLDCLSGGLIGMVLDYLPLQEQE